MVFLVSAFDNNVFLSGIEVSCRRGEGGGECLSGEGLRVVGLKG